MRYRWLFFFSFLPRFSFLSPCFLFLRSLAGGASLLSDEPPPYEGRVWGSREDAGSWRGEVGL